MKVKKYRVKTMKEAMDKIRGELGREAVILNSKAVKTGGFLGLFKTKRLEVIAAVERGTQSALSVKKREEKPKQQASPSLQYEELLLEIKSLKEAVSSSSAEKKFASYPEAVKEVFVHLENQGIQESILDEMAPLLLEKYFLGEANIVKEAKHYIKDLVIPLYTEKEAKKYINLVGPTGVGKTTTLAKLAAKYVLQDRKSVAFITTDTYRVSAISQLKTYADILNVPLLVCYNKGEFEKALEKFVSYDHIIIDTAGRNYRDEQYVKALQSFIPFQNNMDTHLVLALTAKKNDMEEIVSRFSSVPIQSFLFTKSDETSSLGAIINMMHKYKKPVYYITNGQDVPDDLLSVTENNIANFLFEEE
jgi:flagellar biosynthesis protein FlhF